MTRSTNRPRFRSHIVVIASFLVAMASSNCRDLNSLCLLHTKHIQAVVPLNSTYLLIISENRWFEIPFTTDYIDSGHRMIALFNRRQGSSDRITSVDHWLSATDAFGALYAHFGGSRHSAKKQAALHRMNLFHSRDSIWFAHLFLESSVLMVNMTKGSLIEGASQDPEQYAVIADGKGGVQEYILRYDNAKDNDPNNKEVVFVPGPLVASSEVGPNPKMLNLHAPPPDPSYYARIISNKVRFSSTAITEGRPLVTKPKATFGFIHSGVVHLWDLARKQVHIFEMPSDLSKPPTTDIDLNSEEMSRYFISSPEAWQQKINEYNVTNWSNSGQTNEGKQTDSAVVSTSKPTDQDEGLSWWTLAGVSMLIVLTVFLLVIFGCRYFLSRTTTTKSSSKSGETNSTHHKASRRHRGNKQKNRNSRSPNTKRRSIPDFPSSNSTTSSSDESEASPGRKRAQKTPLTRSPRKHRTSPKPTIKRSSSKSDSAAEISKTPRLDRKKRKPTPTNTTTSDHFVKQENVRTHRGQDEDEKGSRNSSPRDKQQQKRPADTTTDRSTMSTRMTTPTVPSRKRPSPKRVLVQDNDESQNSLSSYVSTSRRTSRSSSTSTPDKAKVAMVDVDQQTVTMPRVPSTHSSSDKSAKVEPQQQQKEVAGQIEMHSKTSLYQPRVNDNVSVAAQPEPKNDLKKAPAELAAAKSKMEPTAKPATEHSTGTKIIFPGIDVKTIDAKQENGPSTQQEQLAPTTGQQHKALVIESKPPPTNKDTGPKFTARGSLF